MPIKVSGWRADVIAVGLQLHKDQHRQRFCLFPATIPSIHQKKKKCELPMRSDTRKTRRNRVYCLWQGARPSKLFTEVEDSIGQTQYPNTFELLWVSSRYYTSACVYVPSQAIEDNRPASLGIDNVRVLILLLFSHAQWDHGPRWGAQIMASSINGLRNKSRGGWIVYWIVLINYID